MLGTADRLATCVNAHLVGILLMVMEMKPVANVLDEVCVIMVLDSASASPVFMEPVASIRRRFCKTFICCLK